MLSAVASWPQQRENIFSILIKRARRLGTTRPGPKRGGVSRMSTHTSGIDANHKRLDVARTLYKALVAQDPDRQITLCDGSGRMLVRSERRRNEDTDEKAS